MTPTTNRNVNIATGQSSLLLCERPDHRLPHFVTESPVRSSVRPAPLDRSPGMFIAGVALAMTKRNFITALYKACPAFMRDLKSFVNFDVATRMRISVPDETRNDLSEKEFFNKWPRASRIMSQELILEVI